MALFSELLIIKIELYLIILIASARQSETIMNYSFTFTLAFQSVGWTDWDFTFMMSGERKHFQFEGLKGAETYIMAKKHS